MWHNLGSVFTGSCLSPWHEAIAVRQAGGNLQLGGREGMGWGMCGAGGQKKGSLQQPLRLPPFEGQQTHNSPERRPEKGREKKRKLFPGDLLL